MASPISLKEFFAAAGSGFTREDAEAIGPQLEELGKFTPFDRRTIVDVARSENSPLNRFFEWDDAKAADLHRLDRAGSMMKAIRVRTIEDGRPRVTAAYRLVAQKPTSGPPPKAFNVLHADSAFAARMAISAHGDLVAWRAKYEPYMGVWTDFATAFREVVNQIDECGEIADPKGIDRETDDAMAALLEWRARFGAATARWQGATEQTGSLLDAIAMAEELFAGTGVRQRPCLRCRAIFSSAGIRNRLCDRCSR